MSSSTTMSQTSKSGYTSPATQEFNTVFRYMSDNVRRLQRQLQETQSTMKRLSERAQTLKRKADTQPQPQPQQPQDEFLPRRAMENGRSALRQDIQHIVSRSPMDVATAVPPLIKEDRECQTEETIRSVMDSTVQTEDLQSEISESLPHSVQQRDGIVQTDVVIDVPPSHSEENADVHRMQQHIITLQEKNVVLQQTITEYEASMGLILQKSMDRMEQLKNEKRQQQKTFDLELSKERLLCEEMRQENQVLREKMRGMVHVMQEAASCRDREKSETDAYALQLWKETQMLRNMLMLSDKDISRQKGTNAESLAALSSQLQI